MVLVSARPPSRRLHPRTGIAAGSSELSALSSRFAYLTRWIAQLEERKFQLSI
jgi:hypothetical protein